jgi:tRNA A-37 threonylcarbamoyl transferase component Bud32
MILVILHSGSLPPEGWDFLVTSKTLSDEALQEQVVTEVSHFFQVSVDRHSFAYVKEQRLEQFTVHLNGRIPVEYLGNEASYLASLLPLEADAWGPIFAEPEEYNNPELWRATPSTFGVPVELGLATDASFNLLKRALLQGRVPRGTIHEVEDLLRRALQWGGLTVLTEIVGLLLGVLHRRPDEETYRLQSLDSVCDQLGITSRRQGNPLRDAIADGMIGPYEGIWKLGEYIRDWRSLIAVTQKRGWALANLEDLATRCFGSRSLAWLCGGQLARIARYTNDPKIELEELVELVRLPVPYGYHAVRRLSNSSAFKVVYEGRDREGRAVAIKRYKDWESEQLTRLLTRLRLTKETLIEKDIVADWMAGIRHTHILPCTAATNQAGEIFIIEPLLDTTLDKVEFTHLNKLIRAVRQILQALAYLHSEGWIHSDIKPDNIGLLKEKAMLLDFGISTLYSSDSRPRSNPGSIKTRAPELFSERALPNFASDIWSVGATLLALCTQGEYPLVHRDEANALPPAGDPQRSYLEARITDRIREYQREPSRLTHRIRSVLPKDRRLLLETITLACQIDPVERPSAQALDGLLMRIAI